VVVLIGDFSAGVEELSVFKGLGLGIVLEVLQVIGDEFFFEFGDEKLIFRMGVLTNEGEVADKAVSEEFRVIFEGEILTMFQV
jgi:hypothetical protein